MKHLAAAGEARDFGSRRGRETHCAGPMTAVPEDTHSKDPNAAGEPVARRLLDWFDRHGRKDLPWQADITPYRVWVSEIMLQQTQVRTVIPYYQRFMAALPDVHTLAAATEDTVLHLWTGLGYYARARNLHRAAQLVVSDFAGEFPATVDALASLPGIGRSTAGAIVAIAFRQRAAILDGNVKRVLARHHAVPGWPGEPGILANLWALAEKHTPTDRVGDYTQAIMDLGATVCTRTRPACDICPLAATCLAHRQGSAANYPGRKPRRQLPVRQVRMLLVLNAGGEVLLEKRPPSGIWGGLWSLPELDPADDVTAWVTSRLALTPTGLRDAPELRHTFSHFHLDILPTVVSVATANAAVQDNGRTWYNPRQPDARGLAAPVKALLEQLAGPQLF